MRASGLGRGIGASGLNLIATAVIQICTVPVFIGTVGVDAYADWIVLTAIPAYLSLMDLGLAGASATIATRAIVDKRGADARAILSSAWATVSVSSVVTIVVATILARFALNESSFEGLDGYAFEILVLQLLWAGAWMQIGFTEAGWRAGGNYPRGIRYLTLLRLAEFCALVAVITLTRNLLLVAIALLVVRVVGWAIIYSVTQRILLWFSLSFRVVKLLWVRQLIGPSLTYAGFPVGLSVLNQGLILVVAAKLGNDVVVVLTTVRTVSNTVMQLSNVVTAGALPELTKKLAEGKLDAARKAQRLTLMLSGFATSVACIALAFVGPELVFLWSNGEVQPSRVFMILMLATILADVPWQSMCNMLRAQNAHGTAGIAYLLSCLGVIGVCAGLLPVVGLVAVPISLFLTDIVVTPVAWVALRKANFGLSWRIRVGD